MSSSGSSSDPLAYCFDLDGTLYVGDAAIPGAVAALARLRAKGIPFRCLSNTTSRSRDGLVARLQGYGFDVRPDEVLTATLAGAALLRERGHRTVAAFVPDAALEDLGDVTIIPGGAARESRVDAVVVGDMGDAWTAGAMQRAFELLMAGADFIALSRDRYWRRGDSLVLDCGAYVAGLEHATGRAATVTGKPSAAFFAAALASLGPGLAAPTVAMVGDDPWSDIAGARAAGLQGWFVASGKYDAAALAASGVTPERVLQSIAELPA